MSRLRIDQLHLPRLAAWLLVAQAIASPAHGAMIAVPIDQPTIQAAIDAAAAGDTILVHPGIYAETVRIGRDGLTIAAADASRPPLLVAPGRKGQSAIAIEHAVGVVLQGFVIRGPSDGVLVSRSRGVRLTGLRIEDAAVGVRLRQVELVLIDATEIDGVRAQGIRLDRSQDVVVSDVRIDAPRREGALVRRSPRTILDHVTVSGTRIRDGIVIVRSADTTLATCTSSGNQHGGIRVQDSVRVALVDNRADDNVHVGLRVDRSHPIRSTDDLVAGGNEARSNGRRDMAVTPPRCGRRPCGQSEATTTTTTQPFATTTQPGGSTTSTTRTSTTTTTSSIVVSTSTPTTTSMTTTTGPVVALRWRFYVRMALAQGGVRNVDVPYRSIEPRLVVAIQTSHATAFKVGVRMYGDQIAALGGDTLQRLINGVTDYMKAHPGDYPGFAGVETLRWAQRES